MGRLPSALGLPQGPEDLTAPPPPSPPAVGEQPGADPQGGVLGALLLAWTDGAFAAGAAVRPGAQAASFLRPGGWGNGQIPLRDVTDPLLGR